MWFNSKVTSAPFQETNLGARILALLAQPLPRVTLAALEGLNYGSPTTASWAQPSHSPLQMHQAAAPNSSRTGTQEKLQQSSRGEPAAPSHVQAQREQRPPRCPTSAALLGCQQPPQQRRALPGHGRAPRRPRAARNGPCRGSCCAEAGLPSVSWGHGSLCRPHRN